MPVGEKPVVEKVRRVPAINQVLCEAIPTSFGDVPASRWSGHVASLVKEAMKLGDPALMVRRILVDWRVDVLENKDYVIVRCIGSGTVARLRKKTQGGRQEHQ
jgi:hypothetical protein